MTEAARDAFLTGCRAGGENGLKQINQTSEGGGFIERGVGTHKRNAPVGRHNAPVGRHNAQVCRHATSVCRHNAPRV